MKTEPLIQAERAPDGRPIFTTPLTLLDYFAGQALAASDWSEWKAPLVDAHWQSVATRCYEIAEAMLAERERRQEGSKEREQ